MRRSANRAARYAAQGGLSSRKHGCKWHYIFRKSWNSISLPTRNQRLARNLPIGLSKLGLGTPERMARGSDPLREDRPILPRRPLPRRYIRLAQELTGCNQEPTRIARAVKVRSA